MRAQAPIKVQEWIHQNPVWKQKIKSRELNISIQSMLHLIRDDQHMAVHHISKGYILTAALKVIQ